MKRCPKCAREFQRFEVCEQDPSACPWAQPKYCFKCGNKLQEDGVCDACEGPVSSTMTTVTLQRALAKRVLVVVVEGAIGDWAAYIDAVPGINHALEATSVASKGEKLHSSIAAAIFPSLDIKKYRS